MVRPAYFIFLCYIIIVLKVAIMEKYPNMKKKILSNFETKKSFSVWEKKLTTIFAYDWMRPNWMIMRRD